MEREGQGHTTAFIKTMTNHHYSINMYVHTTDNKCLLAGTARCPNAVATGAVERARLVLREERRLTSQEGTSGTSQLKKKNKQAD